MQQAFDLDDPIGAGLRTSHAQLAERHGLAIRYWPDVAPFCSIGTTPTAEGWTSLLELSGDSPAVLFMEPGCEVPDNWQTLRRIPLAQMVYAGQAPDPARTGNEMRSLGGEDVPEMLRLTELAQPGPFLKSTVEFGGYVGIFDGPLLVAMAGRRMNPPGYIEVSAVCTDPGYRGRGYARTVMLEVMRGIMDDGSMPFLHVADGNPARKLYEDMGFVARRNLEVLVLSAAVASGRSTASVA
jgi:predicted GNAT family acetyltransferase